MTSSIKITQLPALTNTPASSDLVLIVDTPSTSPTTKSISVGTLFANVTVTSIVAGGTIGTTNQILISNATAVNWTSNLSVGIIAAAGNVTITGNVSAAAASYASGNVVISSSGVTIANISGTFIVGVGPATTNGFIANSTTISVGNSTVNTFSNSSHFFSGNSTVYALGNSAVELLYTSIAQTVMSATTISVGGNTLAQTYINSTAILVGNTTVGNLTLGGNTLNLGTSLIGANGYTWLPNTFKMNWGQSNANSTAAVITIPSAYVTNIWSITASANALSVNVAIYALTKTSFTVVTSVAANTLITWNTIGS